MDAAEVLGLFLRAWRETWVGWSREQLARAVGRHLGNPVRTHVIRAWEEGQPPADTDELLALERVLRQSGLTEREVRDFRDVVLGALAARRYPGLEPIPDILHRPDVEEIAERETASWDGSLVRAIALREALAASVLGDARPLAAPRQRRAQEAALARAMLGLTCRHEWAGRFERMLGAAVQSREYVTAFFGEGGLGDGCCPLSREASELWALWFLHNSPEHARRLLTIHTEALRRGLPITAITAYFWAVECSAALPPAEAAALLRHAERMHDLCHEVRPDCVEPHFHLLGQAQARGNWNEAEAQLLQLRSERPLTDLPLVIWLNAWADLALARGDVAEAETHYGRSLEGAVRGGYGDQEKRARQGLVRCEERHGRRRGLTADGVAAGA